MIGVPEINSSSVGMAKAALDSINELDLFGAHGGPSSVIHCIPDEMEKCNAVLTSMLPRESISKEIDAALLAIISYPAFAVDDYDVIENTRNKILERLRGKYGLKRFLRDGYNTPLEDKGRNYYETWELATFEKIECEWPVFFCYLLMDALFRDDKDKIEEYWEAIHAVAIVHEDGSLTIPEMYSVPRELVDEEKSNPHAQRRVAAGRVPFLWGQSMYILCSLIKEGYLQAGEIDPLCRRNVVTLAPKADVVLQVGFMITLGFFATSFPSRSPSSPTHLTFNKNSSPTASKSTRPRIWNQSKFTPHPFSAIFTAS